MKLSDNQKTYLILGVGGALIAWWWYRTSKGLSLIPNNPFSGGGGFAGSQGAGTPTVGGTTPIDNKDIIAARDAQTGTLARKSCIYPMRWINTTTGPYYGKCVTNDVFSLWTKLPGDVQQYATDATYAEFMRSIGRG